MTSVCAIDSWWKSAVWHRELSALLCDNLDGWDGGGWVRGRLKRKGIYAYIHLIHFVTQQKLAQLYKAIILQ